MSIDREKRPRVCHWVPFSLTADDDNDVYSIDEDEEGGFGESASFDEMAENSNGFRMPKVKLYKGIITSGGVFPINAGNDPTDNFNIWILHTNFRIKEGDLKKLAEVEGVESIRPFSRYRVQFVIAMLFDAELVMREIEEVLGAEVNYSKDITLTPELIDKLDLVKSEAIKNRHWLIYILPSGHIKYTASNEINSEIRSKMDLYRSTYDAIGGYLIASNNLFA